MLRAQESRLLRFPTIYGDNVCFTYAGNLYTCSANGGTARRLTDHEGVEIFSKYSPDGSKIVFRASRPKTEAEIKEYKELQIHSLQRDLQ